MVFKVTLYIFFTYTTVIGIIGAGACFWALLNILLFGFPEDKKPPTGSGKKDCGDKVTGDNTASSSQVEINPQPAAIEDSEESDFDLLGPTPDRTFHLDLSRDVSEIEDVIPRIIGGGSEVVPFGGGSSLHRVSHDFFNFIYLEFSLLEFF